MANYNVKYRGQFRDIDNVLWTVDILKDEIIEEIEEITLADPPVTVEYKQDDIFQPIKCSSATIRILTPEILDIYTGKIDVKIEIYKNNNLFWWGWNTPNIYSSEYSTNLDLIEINAIDSIAVLDYTKFSPFGANNTFTFNISYFEQVLAQTSSLSYTWYSQDIDDWTNLTLYQVSIYKSQENPDKFGFQFYFRQNDETFTFFTFNDSIEETINLFQKDNNTVDIVYSVFQNTISFTSKNLVYVSVCPVTATKTENISERITFLDEFRKILKQDIIYFNDFSIELDDLYFNEEVFLDEDKNDTTAKETLAAMCRYLGCTLWQWQDKYYLINLEIYYKAIIAEYKTTFTLINSTGTSTFDTFLTIPQMEVANNISTISRGSIYNQINVQAKLEIEDKDKTGDIFKDITYLYNDTFVSDDYRYKVETYIANQNLVKLKKYPDSATTTFDEHYNVTYMQNGKIVRNQYVINSSGWNKNLYFPHSDFQKYYRYFYKNPIMYDLNFPQANVKQVTVFLEKYRDPQEIFTFVSPKQIFVNGSDFQKNLVLNFDLYCGKTLETTPYVEPSQTNIYTGTTSNLGEGIINFVWAKVQIGNKYWNGNSWTSGETWFTVGLGGEDVTENKIKTDTWYSPSNTTPTQSKLSGWNIPLRLGAYLNGYLTVTLGIPQYQDLSLNCINPQSSVQWTATRRWDVWRTTYATATEEYRGFATLNSLNTDYIFIKNFSLKVESTNFDEELTENDVIYSQEIDKTLIQSLDDVTMLLNTYDPDISEDMSNSYVLFNNGTQYLSTVHSNGLNVKPEQHIVHKYCNYYSKPKLIIENEFFTNQVEPLDIIKVSYRPEYFIVGDITYDLRYKQNRITAYEI